MTPLVPLSAVSHELRTPLTAIRMYAEMLEKNWVKTEDKRQHYYTNVRQESERLSRLIDNVLDFSRIQRKKKQYHFELGDLNACIQQVVEMMTPFAAQNDFSLNTDLADLTSQTFDKDAITQIVVNLVDNAIKYAKDSQDKTICIRTLTRDQHTILEVEDHGPGIPHTQQRHIFDPFYRTENESTRQTQGTGLGLALVKRFTEAHQGTIEILNAQPTGALFRVTLRLGVRD
jgi:signal transduction histidine kinase